MHLEVRESWPWNGCVQKKHEHNWNQYMRTFKAYRKVVYFPFKSYSFQLYSSKQNCSEGGRIWRKHTCTQLQKHFFFFNFFFFFFFWGGGGGGVPGVNNSVRFFKMLYLQHLYFTSWSYRSVQFIILQIKQTCMCFCFLFVPFTLPFS